MSTPPPPQTTPYSWLIRILAVMIALTCIYRVYLVYRTSENPALAEHSSPSQELRRIRIIPSFSLTERNGKTITNQDLNGKIWVADFIYTTCPGPCPLVSASMARLQNALANDPHVQLVTFTVDPQNDTPAVLAKYADHYGADPNRWWFLTGPEKPLYELIQNGFLQSVVDNRTQSPQTDQFTVTHSTSLVLVDAQGNMRGSYETAGSGEQAELLRDIKILEKDESP